MDFSQLEKEIKYYQRDCLLHRSLDECKNRLVKIRDLIKQHEQSLQQSYSQLNDMKSTIARLTQHRLLLEDE